MTASKFRFSLGVKNLTESVDRQKQTKLFDLERQIKFANDQICQIDKENFKLQEKLSNFRLAQSLAIKLKKSKDKKLQPE